MAAGKDFNATDYIQHHLTFLTKPVGEGEFWVLNVDSVITAFVLGVLALGAVWWVVRGATSGVPNKRQALVELLFEFIDDQVKTVCSMVSDWEVYQNRDLPEAVWDYLKKERFLGMIVPKEYGGLGFSAVGQSEVLCHLATHSTTLCVSAKCGSIGRFLRRTGCSHLSTARSSDHS